MMRLWRVVWREVVAIAGRPAVWGAVVILPLFCALLTATVFGSGAMRELPIGVIDMDSTPTSRAIIRTLDASPTLTIVTHLTSPHEALNALRRGEIYGYVLLPRGVTRALTEGSEATIPYYYHYALMSIGSEVATTLRTLLTELSAEPIVESAVARGVRREAIEAVVMPVGVDIHPVGNPTLNYKLYLSAPFFFIMFQIIVMLTTLYTVGSERERGSAEEWLGCAGGNMRVALVGKLTPYLFSFVVAGGGSVAILHHFGALAGGIGHTLGAMVLLTLASASLSLFIYGLLPMMGIAMSLASMVGSLGATLSGVTLPTEAMYPLFDHLARLLPVRHFTLLVQATSEAEMWHNTLSLLLFIPLPMLIVGRLRRSLTKKKCRL